MRSRLPPRVALIALVVLLALPVAVLVLRLNLGGGPVVVAQDPLVGQPAPDIRLASLDGTPMALSDLRGKPVIINFWASWCLPCRDEFPLLKTTRERYGSDGLEILGVVHDDGADPARAFAASYGATWPMVVDTDDVAWNAYHGAFLPISYFVDRAGIVRAVSYGPPPVAVMDQYVAKII